MRIAAIYDIHANLPALEAVLQEIHQVGAERVVVGGDVVPGPMPRETIERLLDLDIPVQFIRGNGEVAVLSEIVGKDPGPLPAQAREAVRWTAQQLQPEHERLLRTWPKITRLQIPELGEVLFCHATPRSETEIFTHQTSEERLLPLFDGLGASVVVCGHTHMQFDRMIGATRVLNAGSVGMPFGKPGAYWILLDPGVQFRRTPYDFTEAAARVRATSHPQAQTFAVESILQPPSEEQMGEAFARAESK